MSLAGTLIYPVICASLQKIATGWQGLVPSDWCRQCFTNPGNNKPLGNALRPPLGNQEYQKHRQHEEHVNSPLSPWHIKTAAPSYKDEEKRTGCFLKYAQLWHVVTKQSNSLKKNPKQTNSSRLTQMPGQYKAAKRKISFSSALIVYECAETPSILPGVLSSFTSPQCLPTKK